MADDRWTIQPNKAMPRADEGFDVSRSADGLKVIPRKAMPGANEGYDVTGNDDGSLKVTPRDAIPRADKGFDIKPAGSVGDALAVFLAPYLIWLVFIPLFLPLTISLYILPGYFISGVVFGALKEMVVAVRTADSLVAFTAYLIIAGIGITSNIFILPYILKCSLAKSTFITLGGFFAAVFLLGAFIMAVANQVVICFTLLGLANLIAFFALKLTK